MPQNININADFPSGGHIPSAFQAWEKGCEDALAFQKELCDYALLSQEQRYSDRAVVNQELFNEFKTQVDTDFQLYKLQRDNVEKVLAKHNNDVFDLYRGQRDSYDELSKRISSLETKQAVSEAVEPWRAKVLDMRINGVAQGASSAVALEAERRCCADNQIINYLNSTFYPTEVADITVDDKTTRSKIYNPLCGCCTL